MYTTPLTELTDAELQQHYSQLLDRESAVIDEQNRRRALPYIWKNEAEIVRNLRAAGVGPVREPKDPFTQPTNITEAYLAGDVVTYEDVVYEAKGDGAIMHAPTVIHPIMGDRWDEVVDA